MEPLINPANHTIFNSQKESRKPFLPVNICVPRVNIIMEKALEAKQMANSRSTKDQLALD